MYYIYTYDVKQINSKHDLYYSEYIIPFLYQK